ncbi:MAG: hypothetical protein O7D91_07955 [Planctomycetota bacterium]|nr:hypothetical protein [Planctomycetota bacterium]
MSIEDKRGSVDLMRKEIRSTTVQLSALSSQEDFVQSLIKLVATWTPTLVDEIIEATGWRESPEWVDSEHGSELNWIQGYTCSALLFSLQGGLQREDSKWESLADSVVGLALQTMDSAIAESLSSDFIPMSWPAFTELYNSAGPHAGVKGVAKVAGGLFDILNSIPSFDLQTPNMPQAKARVAKELQQIYKDAFYGYDLWCHFGKH